MTSPALLVWGDVTGVGGTETRMAEVIRHWQSLGRTTISVMLTAEKRSPLRLLLTSSGSEVIQTRASRDIARIVRRRRPRFVAAFGLRASLAVRALRLPARLQRHSWPHVIDARNGLEMTRRRSLWLIDRLTQGLVDTFLANSDAAAAELTSRGFAAHRVKVLHSAIGEAWQRPTAVSNPEPTSVVMVGNARPEKQQWLGLEVFAQLPQPATLTVFTNNAHELRAQWSGLVSNARGTVTFREGCSVTPEDLERAAIMLHPSSSESAPRCLMEGRVCGCHVVAFDVGDTRRIVADGGTVVPPGDDAGLLAALSAALRASSAGTLPRNRARFATVPEYAAALSAFGERR